MAGCGRTHAARTGRDFYLSAAAGRISLAAARVAIHAALDKHVDAVVAAPQNQTSIALAGIEFDGYPSFVARETGLGIHDVYLML